MNTAYLYIRMHGVFGEYADTIHWYTSLTTYCNEHFIATHTPVVCEEPNYPYVANTKFRRRPMGAHIFTAAKSGDVLISPDAPTMFTSSTEMLQVLTDLSARDVGVVILNTGHGTIDTTTATGKYAAKFHGHYLSMLKDIHKTRSAVINTDQLRAQSQPLTPEQRELGRRLLKLREEGLRGKALARRYLLMMAKDVNDVPLAEDMPRHAIQAADRLIRRYRQLIRKK